jgi:predicted N-acetyltransferase YhbS
VDFETTIPTDSVRVRLEEPEDVPAIRAVNNKAFAGETEARIVTVSMVAVIGAAESVPVETSDTPLLGVSTWGGEGRGWGERREGTAESSGHEPDRTGVPARDPGRVLGGEVVGHALVSPVKVITDHEDVPLLGLGPVAVLPEYQGQGVGTLLVETCLEHLRQSGHAGVVVVGDPAYYSRFGFIPAGRWGLRGELDTPEDAFMALELSPGKLAGISGIVRYRPEFIQGASL